MNDLRLLLVQPQTYWQDIGANLSMLEEMIWSVEDPGDVILLPEMFNTGFSMKAMQLAEPMNSRTFRWMKQIAQQKDAVVSGSFMVKDGHLVYNRLLWMQPDGDYYFYDKRHLFRMAGEEKYFEAGQEKQIVTINGWKICLQVCYDLRFPVWARNSYDDEQGFQYDLLVYVANWPQARINAWQILLQARAMENLCYTVGINRTGPDGDGIDYNGQSAVYGPKGETELQMDESPGVATVHLNKKNLTDFREKFPVQRDADTFFIQV